MSGLAIDMTGISKAFGPVKALVDADLRVARGTIHGLVGQNGAGKSTIIKVLAGILKPDSGRITINGTQVESLTPASVERLGVHFIHQERLLVPTATVAEAVFLNYELRFGPFLRPGAMKRRAEELIRTHFGLELPGDTLVRDLTTAQQKIVQITRALAQEAQVLVLDEPTAALVKREVDSLFAVLRNLRAQGIAVIFISHYMQEIEDLCDEVTVMRNGTDVGVVRPGETSIDEIVSMMIARDVGEMFPRRSHALGAPVLRVEGLSQAGHFRNVSFEVRAGEVLGITGLLGSGVKELVECLFGLEQPDAGSVTIDGEVRRFANPGRAVQGRVALVPEDRRAHGVATDMSVRDNITIASLERYMTRGFVSRARENEAVDGFIRELSIKTPHRDQLVRNLSGGNQQKVALAKWLSCQSRVYVLDEPTVAVDVGAKVEIYTLLNRLAAEGAAILFLSSDLLEIAGFCDRALVVYRGTLNGEFAGETLDSDLLLAAASGARAQRKEA
ncbi:sugar ABC transporter ATP-binding protein [Cereibacter sphaeroides]|jgi:ribose transport system ATP-binding protein|uniref:sugar ABC transporter ATP-binding protein n=1 Tax=Cereibacter sphaeroides TaxID=1063 RepID=UPI0000663DFA|nr:ABC transporter related [Cereibacter sphaeroides ATCC 17029]